MDIKWEDGFSIRTSLYEDEMTISANRAGLISLAKSFLALADGVPGDHFHLDVYNSLEEGSSPLVIELISEE